MLKVSLFWFIFRRFQYSFFRKFIFLLTKIFSVFYKDLGRKYWKCMMNFPNLIPLIINKSVDLTQSSFFRLCDFKLFPFMRKLVKSSMWVYHHLVAINMQVIIYFQGVVKGRFQKFMLGKLVDFPLSGWVGYR